MKLIIIDIGSNLINYQRRINIQGTNPLTMLCTYETPCGWCTKWDKECDKKPYKRGLRVQINPIDDVCGLKLEKITKENENV